MLSPRFTAHFALILANILLGLNFSLFYSVIHHYMAFETLFFLRVAVAALWFTPWVLSHRRFRIQWKDFPQILIPTVLVIYGHEFMMLWGAKYTNPADASIIATMAPLVTLVVSAKLVHESGHWLKRIGVVLGMAGSAVLIFQNGIPKIKSEELGNLFILINVFAAATNTIFIKPALVKYGTLTITGWYYIIGMMITAPFFGHDLLHFDLRTLPLTGYVEIGFIVTLGTILPNYLLYYGTEKLTSVHTGLYAYWQPISATALGLYRHQVTFGYDNLIASALIFSGIILVVITYKRYSFPIPNVKPLHPDQPENTQKLPPANRSSS